MQIKKLSTEEAKRHAQDIAQIYRDVWVETYRSEQLGITRQDLLDHFGDLNHLVEQWRNSILGDPQRGVWVALDGDRVVAFCVARKRDSEYALEYIYILPECQGHGVGTHLLQAALKWLGNQKPIVLYGAAYNDRAITFYQRFGFVLSDEKIPAKVLKGGKTLPAMKMVLRA